MSERMLLPLAMALLFAGAGLWLWVSARQGQRRQAASRHLERQLGADLLHEAPPFEPLGRAAPDTEPPLDGAPRATATRVRGRLPGLARLKDVALPGWLQGVVSPGLLGGCVALALLAVGLCAWRFGPFIGVAALVLALLLGAFVLWLRVQRFRRHLVAQLPGFIDSMVRLITIGNSTHAAFQLSIASTKAPLRGYLESASSLVRAGADLDQAMHQMARNVRVEEMYLLAAILGLGVRYGGRADVLLERVGNFMRDREQAEHELMALSAETRLSAWVLGLLPVVVGLLIVMMNANYFASMWNDGTGRTMIYIALGLQALGAVLLYRLARLA